MSENIKPQDTLKKEDYTLPPVNFPSMDMPQPPIIGIDVPEGVNRMDCEGQFYSAPLNSQVMPPKPGKARILIGVPILCWTHEFAESFLKFWTQLCTDKDASFDIGYYFVYRKPVHLAEQIIVEVAQHNHCTHVLFMDDDIYDITVADLKKLLAADKDVIGGVMYASKFPYAMCVFRRYNTDRKVIDMPVDNSLYRLYEIPCKCQKCGYGQSHWDSKFCPLCGAEQGNLVQPADLIPFAFTLMKLSVFDRIKKPWFHCTSKYPTDSWFADRLIEAGIQEYAHMGVRLNHAGINDLSRQFRLQEGLELARRKQGGVVGLSPEEMQRHEYMLNKKMTEAEELTKPKPDFLVGEDKWTVKAQKAKQEVTNDCKTGDLAEVVS